MHLLHSAFVAVLVSSVVYACGSSENARRPHGTDEDGGGDAATASGGRTGSGGAKATGGTQASGGTMSSGGAAPDSGGTPGESGGAPASGGAVVEAGLDASTPVVTPDAPPLGEFCNFLDTKLEDVIRQNLYPLVDGGVLPDGPIPVSLAGRLRELDMFCDCDDQYDFTGVECLVGLEAITLSGVYTNIEKLNFAPNLRTVNFSYTYTFPDGFEKLTKIERIGTASGNYVKDLSPLSGMTTLTEIRLPTATFVSESERVQDIEALAGLKNLRVLDLRNHRITDLTPLAGLTKLEELQLSNNLFTNLGPLQGLTNLSILSVDSDTNQVKNFAPLVANAGLSDGDVLTANPLVADCASFKADIATLTARGVTVQGVPTCP